MKNKIYRLLSLITLITIFLSLTNTGYAKEQQENVAQTDLETSLSITEIAVDNAEITMQIPNDCYVLTQNIEADDAYIQKLGADKEKIEAYYKEAGIVLNAIAQDSTYEIVVTVNENQNVNYIYNMQSLPDEQIQEFANTIQEAYRGYGYTVDNYSIYENSNGVYVLLNFGQMYEQNSVMCRQYYTIRDSKIYNYTLRSYDDEISKEMIEMMDDMIDSLIYHQDADNTVYQNKQAGVKFELPQGWTEINDIQEQSGQQNLGVQYMHSNGLGESVQFVCVDLWGSMDALHLLVNTREEMQLVKNQEVSNQLKEYVTGFFADMADTYQVSYQGVNYLVSDTPVELKSENVEGEYFQRSAVTIQNGILYAYQYGYYKDSNLHEKDFDYLLGSISYEQPKLLWQDTQHYQAIADMTYKLMLISVSVIILLAIVLMLYLKNNVKTQI